MPKSPLLLAALLPFSLAACSMSPPATPDDGSLPLPGGGSYTTLKLQAEHIAASYAEAAETPATAVEAKGTATYRGVATFGENIDASGNNTPDATGRITLKTDIASGAVTGLISEIRDTGNSAIDGTVKVEGDITDQFLIAADLNGTLSQAGQTSNLTGTFDGRFYGVNAEAIMGYYTGEMDNPFFLNGPLVGFIGAEK